MTYEAIPIIIIVGLTLGVLGYLAKRVSKVVITLLAALVPVVIIIFIVIFIAAVLFTIASGVVKIIPFLFMAFIIGTIAFLTAGTIIAWSSNNFKMTTRERRQAFGELYRKGRTSYGEEEVKYLQCLSRATPDSIINKIAFAIWKVIVRLIRMKNGNPAVTGIDSSKVESCKDYPLFFIFSEMDIRGIKFLVKVDNKKILFPTTDTRANFRGSCFIEVEMHRTDIDHVDFSRSHLLKINYKQKERVDYNMSCVGTIFDEANLIDCNFGRADFKDASFVGTNISGSDFRHARNLTQKQLEEGAYWIRPGMPQFSESFPPGFADTLPNRPPETEG